MSVRKPLPRPQVPPANALEIRLDMDEYALIDHAERALLGVHAKELPRHVAHPWDDVSIIWQPDGTANVCVKMWQAMVPPFPHAVAFYKLAFSDGLVTAIEGVERQSFGA